MKISSPITWIGGKARLLKHILPLLEPSPGELVYGEPFGGSGVVLLNKNPHPSEVYNDLNGDLVNLFRVLRDPDGCVHLWWELVNTPVAREEFRDAVHQKYSPENPVKRAAAFVIACRQQFGGAKPDSKPSDRNWGTARGESRGMNDCVARWLSVMLGLPNVHRRLATVVIDQQDAIRFIKQWDTPSTLFYCDPPYINTEAYYKTGFDLKAHEALAVALNEAKARIVLSYYDHELVDRLYPESRWQRKRIKTQTTTCGHFARDPANATQIRKKANTARTELILTNFDQVTRKKFNEE